MFSSLSKYALIAATAFSFQALSADDSGNGNNGNGKLLNSANFNVTLVLSSASEITAEDLDFGTKNPAKLREGSAPIESTTGIIHAYSNAIGGQYVKIVASDPKYLSQDGYSFLLNGRTAGNSDTIPFILVAYENADGSDASGDGREILPGYIVITGDGTVDSIDRQVWGRLRNNEDLKSVAADSYLAVLTAEHYSNQ